MNPRLGWGLLASVLLGSTVFVLPLALVETDPAAVVAPPGDRVRAAIKELRVDRVHVNPDGRDMLDEAGEARLEAVLADSDPSLYVVVWAETDQAGYSGTRQAIQQLATGVDPDGVFAIWQGPGSGDVDVLDGYVYTYLDLEGDAEARLTELAASVQGEEVEDLGEGPREVVAGAVIGAMGGLAAYGVLMLVVGLVRLRRGRDFFVPGPSQGLL